MAGNNLCDLDHMWGRSRQRRKGRYPSETKAPFGNHQHLYGLKPVLFKRRELLPRAVQSLDLGGRLIQLWESPQWADSRVWAARARAWASTASCDVARLASLASIASFTPGMTTAA